MNDDYLWDRTGEPDPQIERLEQVLGTLRYQPRSLELPAHVRIVQTRVFFPRIAIAAALAVMLVTAGLWLLVSKQDTSVSLESASNFSHDQKTNTAPESVAPLAKDAVVAKSPVLNGPLQNKPKRRGVRKSQMAGNKQFLKPSGSALTAKDRAEAQAAKEQLVLALRVASAKLNLAQKKAQGAYPANLMRNHHKVG